MYEPGRHLNDSFIAGFKYWDGYRVLSELKVGTPLILVPEPDNPHDPSAVAIYFNATKLGYIKAGECEFYSKLMFYGYGGILEAFISQINLEADPYRQVRVSIRLKDNRVGWRICVDLTPCCHLR